MGNVKKEDLKRTRQVNVRISEWEAAAIKYGQVCAGIDSYAEFARKSMLAYAANASKAVARKS